ncbi:hypothetical protein Pelo_19761 [Pelomyxa schiedti]|nr:hypothetical protein Pelo_19761 [Pelomyxa schiedti]
MLLILTPMLYADDVYASMIAGKMNWGKIVTPQKPQVTIACYNPYMSASGKLLGVIQRSYSVRGLSDSLREIAAGKNVIYVTTQDGFLLGTSNGSVVTVDETVINRFGLIQVTTQLLLQLHAK